MVKCIKGKEYLCKKCVHDHAACVACPPNLKNCYNEDIENEKRCLGSCRKAKPRTKPPKKRLKPSSTIPTIPAVSTFPLSNPSRSVSRSAMHPAGKIRYQPHPLSNSENHSVKRLLIIVSSVFAFALIVIGLIVSLVILYRKISRKKSRRSRVRTEGRRVEEGIPLNDIPLNVRVEENVRGDANNVEANVQTNNEEDANNVEANVQTNNEEEPYPANVIEENQPDHPAQETQPFVGTFDGNQQSEEEARSSRLTLKEAHS